MRRWFEPVLSGLCLGYAVVLALLAFRGLWILDSFGRPLAVDFLSFDAAGRLANHGKALAAYDWQAMHAFHVRETGAPFGGYFGWAYPPLFFLPVMMVAILPYPAAFAVWVLGTLALMALVLWQVGGRNGMLLALAMPPVLANAFVGQNGFLTAALLGAALLALPRRPLLAALFMVLLTYKPQFGLLVPVALIAGGHWRALAATTLLALVYGVGCWWLVPDLTTAFLHNLVQNNSLFLGSGSAGFFKLQSLYGLLRGLGLPPVIAWSAQGAVALALALLVAVSWRRDIAYPLKAALLVTAAVLATPYLYFYDLPLLGLALAFLCQDRAFDDREIAASLAMILLLAACAIVIAPLGVVAGAICAALVVRRLRR